MLDFGKIDRWLGLVAASHGKTIGNVNYLFCDDEEILRVNREFLRHDYFTDIITFDYTHKDRIGGDIFISLDTVGSNAADLGEDSLTELLRVIAHGVLHLAASTTRVPENARRWKRRKTPRSHYGRRHDVALINEYKTYGIFI